MKSKSIVWIVIAIIILAIIGYFIFNQDAADSTSEETQEEITSEAPGTLSDLETEDEVFDAIDSAISVLE